MARLNRISTQGLEFDGGQRIALDNEVFIEADGRASVITAEAKSLDPAVGDVYLHLDGLGAVDGVRIQYDGKKPPKKWWEPQEDVV